jgi:hypothetical protein
MNFTTRPRLSRARALGAAAAMVCGALVATADGSPATRRPSARIAPALCPVAGRAEVLVPDGIDGFRVIVSEVRPGAVSVVTVLAGDRHRSLRAFAPGEMSLLLDEPLRGRRFEIALEPVLDAPAGACVDRVELLRGGAVVGAAEIR